MVAPAELTAANGVVTRIVTVPVVVRAGETTLSEVSLVTVKLALVPPKVTLVVPVKPAPVIVTTVPPVRGPLFGLTVVIASGAT